jgi:hypothetical protein
MHDAPARAADVGAGQTTQAGTSGYQVGGLLLVRRSGVIQRRYVVGERRNQLRSGRTGYLDPITIAPG